MARNNATAWALATELANQHEGYSPREVKAQAMALTVLGHSSREVEKKLKEMFPGERIPPFSTIARWQRSRPTNRLAFLRWADVCSRAITILHAHMDRIERNPLGTPLMDVLKIYDVTTDIALRQQYYASLYK
jgi:hypothetical protein